MIKKVLQKLADSIVSKLENAKSDDEFNFFYELGMWLNNISIKYFNFYLD